MSRRVSITASCKPSTVSFSLDVRLDHLLFDILCWISMFTFYKRVYSCWHYYANFTYNFLFFFSPKLQHSEIRGHDQKGELHRWPVPVSAAAAAPPIETAALISCMWAATVRLYFHSSRYGYVTSDVTDVQTNVSQPLWLMESGRSRSPHWWLTRETTTEAEGGKRSGNFWRRFSWN